MTRLVGHGDTPHDPLTHQDAAFGFDPAGDRGFGDGRDRARGLDLEDKKRGLGARIAGGGTQERSDAFRAALKRHGADAGDDTADAAAFLAAQTLRPPLPQPAMPAAAEAPARPSSERVLAVAEACERAMRAELHLQMGRPVSIELGVGALMPGLDRLKVSLDGSLLEVAFVRAADAGAAAATSETIEAAQALAEQLRARFPRRTVRVVELDAADGAAAPGGPAPGRTLTDLFRQGGGA